MCSVCMQIPCASRCPNAPEPLPIKACILCREGIYEGDRFFESDKGSICEACMQDKSYEEILEILGERMETAMKEGA